VVAECDFDPRQGGLSRHEAQSMERHLQLAVSAARQAVRDSELDLDRPDVTRLGVTLGTAVDGSRGQERDDYVVGSRRRTPAGHLAAGVADAVGAEGPVASVSSGCASGLNAVGCGHRLIESGAADVVLAGGSESPIRPDTMAWLERVGATTRRTDHPARAARPFARDRDGFVLGEGAAVLVLEELGQARRRGAYIYGEIAGFATNAHRGAALPALIDATLEQARLTPRDLQYVSAGSGTRLNDQYETDAIKHSLGRRAYEIPVSSVKSMVGHALGAAGAIDLAASVLAIEHSFIPPTANLEDPDPRCDLDYVPVEARERCISSALCLASGLGGSEAALAVVRQRNH
jgi:3-oxoacyl-(acyl-carrier-protein) synthase